MLLEKSTPCDPRQDKSQVNLHVLYNKRIISEPRQTELEFVSSGPACGYKKVASFCVGS